MDLDITSNNKDKNLLSKKRSLERLLFKLAIQTKIRLVDHVLFQVTP